MRDILYLCVTLKKRFNLVSMFITFMSLKHSVNIIKAIFRWKCWCNVKHYLEIKWNIDGIFPHHLITLLDDWVKSYVPKYKNVTPILWSVDYNFRIQPSFRSPQQFFVNLYTVGIWPFQRDTCVLITELNISEGAIVYQTENVTMPD